METINKNNSNTEIDPNPNLGIFDRFINFLEAKGFAIQLEKQD